MREEGRRRREEERKAEEDRKDKTLMLEIPSGTACLTNCLALIKMLQ